MASADRPVRVERVLRQRVITALVLLAILLPPLWMADPLPFALLSLAFIGAAGWEWARLAGVVGPVCLAAGGLLVLTGLVVLQAGGLAWPQLPLPWGGVSLAWALTGFWVLSQGGRRWAAISPGGRLLAGLLILALAWFAMMRSKMLGLNFLLSVFCLAWVADIAAYFGGRRFGRRKLAPAISPGKSWEGVWSGMVGVTILAVGWIAVDRAVDVATPSLYTLIVQRWGWAALLPCVLSLAAMTVVGDLYESVLKRTAGVKDSSGLLPGHGGVLDRIDALLPLFPLAWTVVVFAHA